MQFRLVEHQTINNSMYCETCGRRTYINKDHYADTNKKGERRKIKINGVSLVVWYYIYACKQCDEVKVLIVGHDLRDVYGDRINFLWSFILTCDNEVQDDYNISTGN